jgi:hypothetical protein
LGRTQPLAKYSVPRALTILKDLGFDGVEICLENDDMAPDTLTYDGALSLDLYNHDYEIIAADTIAYLRGLSAGIKS